MNIISTIMRYIMYLVSAFMIFILIYAIAMGLINDICSCANDYALTNLWN
jgi:hypothetical protein